MICIEPRPEQIEYHPRNATYLTEDFSRLDWSHLPREGTLLFFDDHQNAVKRIRLAEQLGFRHAIFEDNYPAGRGDCYSLKTALTQGRHGASLRYYARRRIDATYLRRVLETYYEFPPILRTQLTRWGDEWGGERYATPDPLLTTISDPGQETFAAEAEDYTWICYVRLKTH